MTSKSYYRPEIDGLRAIAILPVLLYHFKLGCSGGFVGVDVFFVISGYLISGIIVREMNEDRFHLASFWERRIRRIFPPLFVMVLATLIAGWFLLFTTGYTNLGYSALYQSFFASNFYFWYSTGGYFTPLAESIPLLHTWSLSIEEQFYLIIPLLFLFLFKKRPRLFRSLIVVLFFVSLWLSEHGLKENQSAAYYLLHSRAWELLLGVLLVLFRIEKSISQFTREILSWLGIAMIIFSVFIFTESTPFPGISALFPCLGTALILQSNEQGRTSLGKLLSLKPMVGIGLISYSLYLWHWPIYVFGSSYTSYDMSLNQKLILIAVSVILSILSWRFVENPFRHHGVIKQRKYVFMSGAAVVLGVSALSALVINYQGFPNRLPDQVHELLSEEDEKLWENYDDSLPFFVFDGENPTFGEVEPDGQLDFVVWGDSFAWSLYPVFDQLAEEKGVSGAIISRGAYAPIRGLWTSLDPMIDTPEWRENACQFILDSGAKHVIIAARWELYLQPQWRMPFQYPLTNEKGRMTDFADSYELIEEYLPKTIEYFEEHGIQVYLMLQIPEQKVDMPQALGMAIMRNADPSTVKGSSINRHYEYARSSNTIISKNDQKNLTILDPIPFLYDETTPIVLVNGRSVYRDFDHLSYDGALLLKPMFESVFMNIKDSKN